MFVSWRQFVLYAFRLYFALVSIRVSPSPVSQVKARSPTRLTCSSSTARHAHVSQMGIVVGTALKCAWARVAACAGHCSATIFMVVSLIQCFVLDGWYYLKVKTRKLYHKCAYFAEPSEASSAACNKSAQYLRPTYGKSIFCLACMQSQARCCTT